MTKKYIVRNCPSFVLMQNARQTYFDVCGNGTIGTLCKDCTDCLIKQVIEKCKSSLDYHSDKEYVLGRTNMAGNILALFEIEEVE